MGLNILFGKNGRQIIYTENDNFSKKGINLPVCCGIIENNYAHLIITEAFGSFFRLLTEIFILKMSAGKA
ncbi:MAG: hypothetical protein ACI4I4_02065 [Acutalibacteraceae bacterium]